MGRPTIKDIAELAGVSIATVSYVINGSRPVSAELAERVEQAIDELEYYPNEVARSLRGQRTSTVGLIVPDSANPFFAEIAKGVEDAGFEAGYTVVLCNSNLTLDRELAYLETLLSKQVDGVIIHPTTTRLEQVNLLIKNQIPVAILSRDAGDMDVDTFRIDNRQAGHDATEHLIDLGHQSIACIKPLSGTNPSAQRVDGYLEALANASIPMNAELLVQGDNTIQGGELATEQLINSNVPFTGIFACNDAMAIGAMRALREAGCSVPDDISVIGFDDIQLASYIQPALTTISNPKYELGSMAIRKLLDRIEGSLDPGPRSFPLDTKLIRRSTTEAPSTRNER